MLECLQKIPMPSPMFLVQQDDLLWAVLRAPFAGCDESGFAAYDIKSGSRVTEISTTKGAVACHIAVDDSDIYCANYTGGSVFKAPDLLEKHEGSSADPVRQTAPHPHSVFFSPDKKYLLSCDLGLDTVFVYDRGLKLISTAQVPAGAGVRHLVFSKDGGFVYCVNEMGAGISVFSWRQGRLQYIDTVSVLPAGFQKTGSGAAIKLSKDGKLLYVTERASGSIVTLEADGAQLRLLGHTDCRGKEPRDFTLLADDRFAVCTNQFSDGLSLFRISGSGIPVWVDTVGMEAPLCAVELH